MILRRAKSKYLPFPCLSVAGRWGAPPPAATATWHSPLSMPSANPLTSQPFPAGRPCCSTVIAFSFRLSLLCRLISKTHTPAISSFEYSSSILFPFLFSPPSPPTTDNFFFLSNSPFELAHPNASAYCTEQQRAHTRTRFGLPSPDSDAEMNP